MESFFTRYRNLIVLLAVLTVQIIGLALQVRRTGEGRSTFDVQDPGGVRLIRLWAEALVSPPEKAIHYTKMGLIATWQNYIDLRHVREQNAQLLNPAAVDAGKRMQHPDRPTCLRSPQDQPCSFERKLRATWPMRSA